MGMTRSNTPNIHQPNPPSKVKKSRGRPKLGRVAVDQGTPELRAKRTILAGKTPPSLQDLSQTIHLLYHRKAITPEQLKTGQSYRLLWEEVQEFFGMFSFSRSSLTFFGEVKGAYCPWDQPWQTPEHKEDLLHQWRYAQRLLAQEDVKIQLIVHRIIINNYITPEMIQEDVAPPLELKQLKKGLDLLQDFFNPCKQKVL